VLDIPLHDRRKLMVERFQLIQDLFGIILLAPACWARLQAHGLLTHALGFAEVAAIAFAFFAGIRDLRSHSEPDNSVDLTNLSLGIVLLLEYFFSLSAGHKRFSPLLLTALTGFFLAFFKPWMGSRVQHRRRSIRIDEEGVHVRLARFRKWSIGRHELRNVEAHDDALIFHLRDGSTREIKLRRYLNAEEVRTAVLAGVQPLIHS
jgi:hypothetical protein